MILTTYYALHSPLPGLTKIGSRPYQDTYLLEIIHDVHNEFVTKKEKELTQG